MLDKITANLINCTAEFDNSFVDQQKLYPNSHNFWNSNNAINAFISKFISVLKNTNIKSMKQNVCDNCGKNKKQNSSQH